MNTHAVGWEIEIKWNQYQLTLRERQYAIYIHKPHSKIYIEGGRGVWVGYGADLSLYRAIFFVSVTFSVCEEPIANPLIILRFLHCSDG